MSINTVNVVNSLPTVSYSPNGPGVPISGDNVGGALFSELQARYSALCKFGNLYFIDSDSVTIAAAHTTKGAAGTIKFINGFFNPFGSGVNAHVIAVTHSTVSGTPAGPLFYNAQTLPSGGSFTNTVTGTIRTGLLNTINAAPATLQVTPQVSVVLTRSDAATTNFTQVGVHGGETATAAGVGEYTTARELAGLYIIPPGTAFGMAATGAGTTHVVQTTIYFALLPV